MKFRSSFLSISSAAVILVLIITASIPTSTVYASSLIVNNMDDIDDNTCDASHCSLREAINEANSLSSDETITFSIAGTIYLTSTLPLINNNGSLTIDGGSNITISGDTDNNGTGNVQVIRVTSNASLTLQNLTITKGSESISGGGGILNYGHLTIENSLLSNNTSSALATGGGGIYSSGTGSLTISNSTFSGNSANPNGGGIFFGSGIATITNSTFLDNTATSYGGGIFNSTGILNITDTTFSNNIAADSGGGINNSDIVGVIVNITNSTFSGNQADSGVGGAVVGGGTVNVFNSTFSNNTAPNGDGGGIYMAGSSSIANITNSTFSGNDVGNRGGGIFAFGSVTLSNTTISGNAAPIGLGGGIHTYGELRLKNTIIANHGNGGDCIFSGSGEIIGGTTNSLIEDASTSCGLINGLKGHIIGSDPNLGLLTGSPAYFPLNSGSPAIDAGDDTVCATAPVNNTSQNGVTRPQENHCDMGSFEKTRIFVDVPFSYWASESIERLFNAGITGGCSTTPLNYCPDNIVTRDQMAVFLERGIHGSSFFPPNVSPTFNDTAGNFAEDWIEALKNDGITAGCGTNIYCPSQGVTRAQMAIFLERAMHGASFTPPNVTPTFNDTVGNFAEDWIEALKNDGITSGCGPNIYCPDAIVTRAQMAVFLVAAFNLP